MCQQHLVRLLESRLLDRIDHVPGVDISKVTAARCSELCPTELWGRGRRGLNFLLGIVLSIARNQKGQDSLDTCSLPQPFPLAFLGSFFPPFKPRARLWNIMEPSSMPKG